MHKQCFALRPIAAVVSFIGLATACPDTLRADIYPVTIDTYIDNRDQSNNYGNKNGIKVFSNDGIPEPARGLIALPPDIGTIPAGDLISARLWVYNYGRTPLARDVELYPLTRSFVEGTGTAGSGATWNTYDGTNAWSTAGGDYASEFVSIDPPPPAGGDEGWFSFDILSMLTGANRNNLLSHGLLLKIFDDLTAPDATTGRNFVSSDNTTYWNTHPYFEITAVPEPASAVMLLVGGMVLVGAARPRRG